MGKKEYKKHASRWNFGLHAVDRRGEGGGGLNNDTATRCNGQIGRQGQNKIMAVQLQHNSNAWSSRMTAQAREKEIKDHDLFFELTVGSPITRDYTESKQQSHNRKNDSSVNNSND